MEEGLGGQALEDVRVMVEERWRARGGATDCRVRRDARVALDGLRRVRVRWVTKRANGKRAKGGCEVGEPTGDGAAWAAEAARSGAGAAHDQRRRAAADEGDARQAYEGAQEALEGYREVQDERRRNAGYRRGDVESEIENDVDELAGILDATREGE